MCFQVLVSTHRPFPRGGGIVEGVVGGTGVAKALRPHVLLVSAHRSFPRGVGTVEGEVGGAGIAIGIVEFVGVYFGRVTRRISGDLEAESLYDPASCMLKCGSSFISAPNRLRPCLKREKWRGFSEVSLKSQSGLAAHFTWRGWNWAAFPSSSGIMFGGGPGRYSLERQPLTSGCAAAWQCRRTEHSRAQYGFSRKKSKRTEFGSFLKNSEKAELVFCA
ncbi:hypothetical protein B0H11DRAFT_2076899, partial [Mycena galericulata]